MSLPLRCRAEIDLAALERNLRLIRASLPPRMRYVAVVKADAYGHGLPQVAARLMHAGADLFGVANLAEAVAIREIGPGWPVLLLSPLLPEEDTYVAEYDLIATVSTSDEVRRLDAVGRAAGKPVNVHLKIDTGMGRLGVWHEQAPALCAEILAAPHIRLGGVCTHFASPDEDPAFTKEQRRRFLRALAGCRGLDPANLFVHADNSAGLETLEGAEPCIPKTANENMVAQAFLPVPCSHEALCTDKNVCATLPRGTGSGAEPFNAVRIGLLQFGIIPRRDSLLAQVHTEPVFSFRTRVGIVKKLPRGTGVSYGSTHVLKRDTTIAVLTAGYGDGIPRAASNRAHVLVHGVRCPVLGRVTMDQTIIDVTDVPDVEKIASGDEAVIVGRQGDEEISITEFSQAADTIPWETLCSVTKRVPRVYRTALGV